MKILSNTRAKLYEQIWPLQDRIYNANDIPTQGLLKTMKYREGTIKTTFSL